MSEVTHRVVIVGTGFAGVGAAIRLKRAGITDFVILEKDDDLGGTWRDNTYPGCACDVPSYLYSYSFEQNPDWTRMFARQDEIWAYIRGCIDKYDLGSHIRYGQQLTSAAWDDDNATWEVLTAQGTSYTARAVIAGFGPLHSPRYPDVEGLDTFEGTTFHSAEWNHDHDLAGKRIAVIGTGASAVQFIPQIRETAAHVDVYQRTPSWIVGKPDRPIGAFERALYRRVPFAQRVVRNTIYWALEMRALGFALHPRFMKPLDLQARRHIAKQIADPELREKVTPSYEIGCKRLLISNDFYPALAADDVELVTDGIARVTPDGVVDSNGVERKVDTIIYGTGFDVVGNLTRAKIVGRGGAELAETWEEDGASAHLGISVSGFPNFFLIIGPNTGLGHTSMIFMIERQVEYIVKTLQALDERGDDFADVRPEAERAFTTKVRAKLSGSVWESGCSSWYLDDKGRPVTVWPYFTFKYWADTRRFRTAEYEFGRVRS
ncbi:flavin-containing monooxygenase [Solicola gregarius]|uniref:NAD(P)/FAD-dependent oxidoreductase n=1 Tax=Solicola gregarius TaxID=2908642 RepID=A0AA46TJG0_9ACTN|nr:NAD(P)/FAD-dependent oxidoreductase [Solicola gregarius]UYM06457.1 NAD(P)/FAD-dependent oxidoreductase [Solicola gregarius]